MRYRGAITYEVDWLDDGAYGHALSDVTQYASSDVTAALGATKRSNPERPTAAPLSGTATLIGDDFAVEESTTLGAAVLRQRHRFRIMWEAELLCTGWIQEPRRQEARAGNKRTRYKLVGLLAETLRRRVSVVQDGSTPDTVQAQSLITAITPLESYTYDATGLTLFGFDGFFGGLLSRFGAVAGAFPVETKAGGLGLHDPLSPPGGLSTIGTPDYVVSALRSENAADHLKNYTVAQFFDPSANRQSFTVQHVYVGEGGEEIPELEVRLPELDAGETYENIAVEALREGVYVIVRIQRVSHGITEDGTTNRWTITFTSGWLDRVIMIDSDVTTSVDANTGETVLAIQFGETTTGPPMPGNEVNEVTVTLPDSAYASNQSSWVVTTGNSLGNALSASGDEVFLRTLILNSTTARVNFNLSASAGGSQSASEDFTDQMEQNGTITFVASDGETLVVTGISDSTEPYTWTPSNSAEVIAFANHVRGLPAGQRGLTVTLRDGTMTPGPGTLVTWDTAREWTWDQEYVRADTDTTQVTSSDYLDPATLPPAVESFTRFSLRPYNGPAADVARENDLQSRRLEYTVSYDVVRSMPVGMAYEAVSQNLASIATWDRREIVFPAWFALGAEDAIQARVDGLAAPRRLHVLDLPLWQRDSARSLAVAQLDAGDYFELMIDDAIAGLNIDESVMVLNMEYVLGNGRTPTKRLTVIETG